MATKLERACEKSPALYGMKAEMFAGVQRQAVALLSAYPPDIVEDALAEWTNSRESIPTFSGLKPILERLMQARMAIVSAVTRAAEAHERAQSDEDPEPEAGAERRAGDGWVRAPIRRKHVYEDDRDTGKDARAKNGRKLKASAAWLAAHYPEGPPWLPSYQAPDLGPDVALLRRDVVAMFDELVARSWLDLVRLVNVHTKTLYAPDAFTASELRQKFRDVLGVRGWKVGVAS